jgi:transcriptional regulator with XRE-family HTH domain
MTEGGVAVTVGSGTVSTGIPDLDLALSGLIPGDNVVWVGDDARLLGLIEDRLLAEAGRHGRARTYVTTRSTPGSIRPRLGPGLEVLDARPGGRMGDAMALEQALLDPARSGPLACVVVDGFDALAHRWGSRQALAFFSRVCPRMFETGAVAYWRTMRREVSGPFVERVRKVTQCVLELRRGYLHVIKAEGRRRSLQGQLLPLQAENGTITVGHERALGRLARGLERLRAERNLSQADLARVAGVTPSAISQAEAGKRGLSLDTLLVLSESLGTTLDQLLATEAPSGYVLARRDRLGADQGCTPLLDDPGLGLRAYLVRLGPGASGAPPFTHKGVEMVVVGSGLVQLSIADDTPVLRGGDAVLATETGIAGWRNLQVDPARFFWVLRD